MARSHRRLWRTRGPIVGRELILLGVKDGRVFDGFFGVALGSNRLALEQLVAVAESLP